MKKIFKIIWVLFILLVIIVSHSDKKANYSNLSNELITTSTWWIEHPNNPIIQFNDGIKDMLWNDPSVIKEDWKYKMWLWWWKAFIKPLVISIYYAESTDWINWKINKTPVLENSEWAWDSESVETPSVIKVWDTYHMYYTWYNSDFKLARYSIWHATSKDWLNRIKDKNNPLIVPNKDPLKWWYYTTAEPAIVHYGNKFYLYYASAKTNYPEDWSPFWIMVAKSEDWSKFTWNKIVHSLTESYDKSKYRWYSTPAVYIENWKFYLYHDVVYNPDWFDQVAISSAVSNNWYDFSESEINIFSIWKWDWKDTQVLAPSVLKDWDKIKIWFAWRTDTPKFNWWIGYAEKN